jgi:pentatricopeptide repeat protein
MVQSVIRTSQCHLVERLIDDMVRQGVSRPLAFYESTMKQLAVQKQHMLALSVYDRLQVDGVQPSVVMLSCLVSFASEVGAYDRAIDFFQQLSNQAKPSIRAYMTVLRVHGKRQDWAASLATFREMQAQGVPLDSLALNVVLSTAIAADKMEDAQMLICEGHETLPPISDNVSYNTLIKGYLQRSDLPNAIKVVDRMREYGIKPNQITFNTMMDKAMRSFQRSEAWNLYAMMRDSGLKPDKLTCSILIKGMDKGANHKHIADCVELLQEAGHLCDPATFAALKGVVRDAALQAGETELLDKLQQMRTMPGRFFSS